MHINEQSPRTLRRQLRRHFDHVALWFLDPAAPAGSLSQRKTSGELAAYRDLYAVATLDAPISPEGLRALLEMPALEETAGRARAGIRRGLSCPGDGRSGVYHRGDGRKRLERAVALMPPCPVYLSYHWLHADSGEPAVYDGVRTGLAGGLGPGERQTFDLTVKAPAQHGRFALEVTLVQEGVRWFEQAPGAPAPARRIIEVVD